MTLYEKEVNGNFYCMPKSKIVLIKDGMQIFNPTEDLLLEDGWNLHNSVPQIPTEEDILKCEKDNLKESILAYDASSAINLFYVNNIPMWLDKVTRSGLMLRFQAELASGNTETSLWYEGYEFKLPLETALHMLYALEVYASQCYDNTQRHLFDVTTLTSLEEIKTYDYTLGYPKKLEFSFV
jgi:hypothetical protein